MATDLSTSHCGPEMKPNPCVRVIGGSSLPICGVNCSLWQMKLHYFLFFGALSAVQPYLPIAAQRLGIPVTTVGIIYAIVSLISWLSKPIFGGIADRYQKMKLMIFVLCFIMTTFFFVVLFIPMKSRPHQVSEYFSCSSQEVWQDIGETNFEKLCLLKYDGFCSFNCTGCQLNFTDVGANHTVHFTSEQLHYNNSLECEAGTELLLLSTLRNQSINSTLVFRINLEMKAFQCVDVSNKNCPVDCISQESTKCTVDAFYVSEQFWLFFAFCLIGWVAMTAITSLMDCVCFQLLQGQEHNYGLQRMWGTVGWGIFGVASGSLMSSVGNNTTLMVYAPGFILFLILMGLDTAPLCQLNIPRINPSKSVVKDISALVFTADVLEMIFAVFTVGCLFAIQWHFAFWFLGELGASQLVMGLSLAVQSFVGELPFFFLSGWLLIKLGHGFCLTLSFVALGFRYILFSFIGNPWLVLCLDWTQGPAFALFYSTMASYARSAAPPGAEATMQGVLGGAFEGLGLAVGALLSGLTVGTCGTRTAFRIFGAVSLAGAFLHTVIYYILHWRKRHVQPTEELDHDETEVDKLDPGTEDTTEISL